LKMLPLLLMKYNPFSVKEIKDLFKSKGRQPVRALGQNFLIDTATAESTAASLKEAAGGCRQAVEVGAGLGALSVYLQQYFSELILIDIDAFTISLLLQLPAIRDSKTGIRIKHNDFLKLPPGIIKETPFVLAGNLPYQITSPVFFKVLEEYLPSVQAMIFMIQKEVACRITAAKDSRQYGILSVLLQTFFRISTVRKVSRQCFYPVPRVDSRVLLFQKKKEQPLIYDFTLYKNIVKAAFNQRRKIILKAFRRSSILHFTAARLDRIAAELPYLRKARAENLGYEDYIKILNCCRERE